MPLTPGTRLGRYEILAKLGEGGMGEVYLARDPKINRDVAIKVLPSEFSADSDRLRRFEQEAQAAGALNHPNILAIHDVDTHDGSPYVVSELLEGETLREQTGGSALPTRKAIVYALQMAHGLAAAHGKGIVHRDLKPENLFVTTDGRLKILDFGIAKLVGPGNGGEPQTDQPTKRLNTDPGAVIGTAGYMSPEQVRGQRVDHRSDIFSFGAVLYEMLSGKRAFKGDSAVETLNAILKEDPPDLSTTDGNINPALERVVMHCLEKHPEQRFQSARDLAFALDALSVTTGGSGAGAAQLPSPVRRGNRERLLLIGATAMSLLAALAFAAALFRRAPADVRVVRTSILLPERSSFDIGVVLSTDGRHLAFVGTSPEGKTLLYLRPLDSLAAQALPGTENAAAPFWSPDGRSLGFFADGKLKRVGASGGPPQTLCNASIALGGTWNPDGVIVFAPNWSQGLFRVPAAGGEPEPVTALEPSRGESVHLLPHFLPDGRHFLYLAYEAQREMTLYVGSLDSKEVKRLLKADSYAEYAPPGYLLYVRERTLVAQAFDAEKLELSGEAVPVAGEVDRFPDSGYASFSASENGVLVYHHTEGVNSRLAWFDRAGKQAEVLTPASECQWISLSPDAKRVAYSVRDPQARVGGLWVDDSTGGGAKRITFNAANDYAMVWSPDGSRIVYGSDPEGPVDLFVKQLDGAGKDELLLHSGNDKMPTGWSPDGQYVLYEDIDAETKWDVWALPLSGERKPFAVLRTKAVERQAQFSADGRWIAYTSDETGAPEVYVQAFPAQGGKWQVSAGGGAEPRWRADGRELFYLSPDRRLMSAEVRGGDTPETAPPKTLFETRAVEFLRDYKNQYAASPDGQRFLVKKRAEGATSSPLTVVLNWAADLKQ